MTFSASRLIIFVSVIPENLREEFPSGYFDFGRTGPKDRREAEALLLRAGFVSMTPTYVAAALLDNRVAESLPEAEVIVQVGQNVPARFGYAYLVHPPVQTRDLQDFVKQTFAGCERADDLFMVRERH